jgi:hypothetical protein
MPTVALLRAVFPCAAILLMLAFIATEPSFADTITFQDIGDVLSVDTTSARVHSSSCAINEIEICTVVLDAPPGATFAFTNEPTPVFAIAEPNTSPQVASDALSFNFIGPPEDATSVPLSFYSDSDSRPLGSCPGNYGSCLITENGGVQVAAIITWTNGAMDTINFRSDIDEIPEPSTLLLVFVSLAAFAIRLLNKTASSVN